MSDPAQYRDRIVEVRRVKGGDLIPHPLNWRTHPESQRAALRGILAEVGVAAPLIAYESEEYDGLVLIDGHLRADDASGQEWPVAILDVTDAEADLLLSVLDPIAELADTNAGQFAALLAQLATVDSPPLEMVHARVGRDIGARPPDKWPSYDETLHTDHLCPRCGYEWSGAPPAPLTSDEES